MDEVRLGADMRAKLGMTDSSFFRDSFRRMVDWSHPFFDLNRDIRIPEFTRCVERLPKDRASLVAEVGSFLGHSTCLWVNLARAAERSVCVLAVDTWLGSIEHWNETEILDRSHGYPRLYQTFLAHVIHHDALDRVVPLPLPSSIAARFLESRGVRADLIYIDASHDTRDVVRDLEDWSPILADGGAIVGDDWEWPSVVKAVEQWQQGEALCVRPWKWHRELLSKRTYRLERVAV